MWGKEIPEGVLDVFVGMEYGDRLEDGRFYHRSARNSSFIVVVH